LNDTQKTEPRSRRRATASPGASTVPRQAIKLDEVALRLGISRMSAYNAAWRGQIPTIRVGRLLLVPLPAFERMLEAGASLGPPNQMLDGVT
jgi:excisionase family DNA binding protein